MTAKLVRITAAAFWLLLFPPGAGTQGNPPNRELGEVATKRAATEPLRVVVIGDFGYAGKNSGQKEVSDRVRTVHRERPFHLGLTVGDNFYEHGVASLTDPHWKLSWHDHYDALGFPFYATLGNHDYGGNVQAQIDYTLAPQNAARSWAMPANYYAFTAGPVRFFALDTDEGTFGYLRRFFRRTPWSAEQRDWLRAQLARPSEAAWTIVYGHHPVFSASHHGDTTRLKDPQRGLLPLLEQYNVDVYIAGHEHDMQYIPRNGVQYFIAGGGGKDTRRVPRVEPPACAVQAHGFLALEATRERLVLRLIGADGRDVCPPVTCTRSAPGARATCTAAAP